MSYPATRGEDRRRQPVLALDARLVLLAGACIGDENSALSRTRHAQARTRHAQNSSDRFDKPLAPRRIVHLGETFQCKFESDEVVHAGQWSDRQLQELWGAYEQPREMRLNIPGNSRFDRRIHLEELQPWRGDGRHHPHNRFRGSLSKGHASCDLFHG
jgi:hypothetical protein